MDYLKIGGRRWKNGGLCSRRSLVRTSQNPIFLPHSRSPSLSPFTPATQATPRKVLLYLLALLSMGLRYKEKRYCSYHKYTVKVERFCCRQLDFQLSALIFCELLLVKNFVMQIPSPRKVFLSSVLLLCVAKETYELCSLYLRRQSSFATFVLLHTMFRSICTASCLCSF